MGVPLFGQEHVDRYRETDGEKGHDWQGAAVLLLTTTGRNSGAKRTTPLIYQRHGDDFLVVASNGGGAAPGWFSIVKTATGAPYDEFQAKADREIPVVVLEGSFGPGIREMNAPARVSCARAFSDFSRW